MTQTSKYCFTLQHHYRSMGSVLWLHTFVLFSLVLPSILHSRRYLVKAKRQKRECKQRSLTFNNLPIRVKYKEWTQNPPLILKEIRSAVRMIFWIKMESKTLMPPIKLKILMNVLQSFLLLVRKNLTNQTMISTLDELKLVIN